LSEIRPAFIGFTNRLWTERLQKEIAQILILKGRGFRFVQINPVDVGQKDIAGLFLDADIVLNM